MGNVALLQLVDIRTDGQSNQPSWKRRGNGMDFEPAHLDRPSRWSTKQRAWIGEWNAQNGPWGDFERATVLARTERPQYISAMTIGLLMSDVERLTEYLNTMDSLGYGIQRMPTEDFGPSGKVIYFIRKD